MVWHAAIKLAYDGPAFMGSQRQPGERTVESELINALMRIGAIDSVPASRFRVASRTDRGVSALGNVAAFDTDFPRPALLRALNSSLQDVYAYGVAEVPLTFTPRRAQGRWYRYVLDGEGLDVGTMAECARLFEGRHDFLRFCKPEGRSTVKTISALMVTPLDGSLVIDLHSREFLRNMVRRIVASMAMVGEGKASLADVREALDGSARRDASFGLAPPQGLTLMDIRYGFDFQIECPPTLLGRVKDRRREALSRLLFVDSLLDRCRP